MHGMSERDYAVHAGLSRGAIQKAKSSGRLVLHADASIDAAASDVRRAAATDPSKSRSAPKPPAREPLKPVPDTAVSAVGDTLREHGLAAPVAGGGMTFLQAKTANEVLKAQERKLRLAKLKGDLVERDRAVALVFRLARQERDAWVTWPAPIAALMAADLTAALSGSGEVAIGTGAMQQILETHARQARPDPRVHGGERAPRHRQGLYDYFSEFGLTQLAVDFVLGTAGTQVQGKVRQVLRHVETELRGETMSGVLALVSPEFFDKLIGHAKVEEAYKYFSLTGAQPLREDTRRRFPFAGIVFEEYNATVTLSTGTTETLIPAGEGIAFPLGTLDTFVTHGAPANLIETVNTVGLPIYARQISRPDGSAIEVKTEASILPVNKRPRLAVRIHSSN